MSWPGYWLWGGTEIINVDRTAAYAAKMGVPWLKTIYSGSDLSAILGQTYSTPLQDGAPWVDDRDPSSYDFIGLYPLDVTGVEDSTSTATVVESVLDGGIVGGLRRKTREVVFNLIVVAVSEAGAEAGFRWLKQVLGSVNCSSIWACAAQTVCFLKSPPCIHPLDCTGTSSPLDCLQRYLRSMSLVSVTTGPTVSAKQTMSNGSVYWQIQFTATAGNPYVFGGQTDLVRGFMDADQPYVGGVPDGGLAVDTPLLGSQDPDCPPLVYRPFADPDCQAIIPPPGLPAIPLNCYTFPNNYARRFFLIPVQYVPAWGQVVPRITMRTFGSEPGPMRIRFYPLTEIEGYDGETVNITDPCSYCGDMTIGYMPIHSVMVIDASSETAYIQVEPENIVRRSDGVLYGTDGAPFEWPLLSCGAGFMVTVDTQRTVPHLSMDLSLIGRTL